MRNNTRIISISGNPASGKSTVVNRLIEKLKNNGFEDENIHIISAGSVFRDYYNKLKNLLKSIDNPKDLTELSEDEFLKKIISNREYRKKIQNVYISLKKAGIDPEKLDIADASTSPELASIRHIIDQSIDPGIEALGEQIKEENNPNEVWIIDSRLAFHNIPESYSVRLTVRDKIAAERLYNDKTRGDEDNNYQSVEEAKTKIIERKQGEQERYKRRYGIDLEDPNNYDLIIDTSYSDIDEIADVILNGMEHKREGKEYAKNWASPKIFIPTQSARETGGIGLGSGMNFEEVKQAIKTDGYDPSKPLEVVEDDGVYYLMEGHHRNFACAMLGKTLIPYKKFERYSEEESKKMVRHTPIVNLYDHEGIFDKKKEDGTVERFSYNDIYPGIYTKLQRPEAPDQQEL